jgi:hypothetical protein
MTAIQMGAAFSRLVFFESLVLFVYNDAIRTDISIGYRKNHENQCYRHWIRWAGCGNMLCGKRQ